MKMPANEPSPFPFSFVGIPTPKSFFPQTTDLDQINHLYRRPTIEYNNNEGGLLSAPKNNFSAPKNLPQALNMHNDLTFNMASLGMDFEISPQKMSRRTTFERNLPTKEALMEEAARKFPGVGNGLRKQETKESVDSVRKLRMDYFS